MAMPCRFANRWQILRQETTHSKKAAKWEENKKGDLFVAQVLEGGGGISPILPYLDKEL